MESMTYKNIDKILLETIPEFSSVYDQLVKDFGDAAQTHIVFGELTRFFIKEFEKTKLNNKDKKAEEVVKKILHFIELMLLSLDKKVQELAVVSFLENLWQAEDYYQEIVDSLEEESKKVFSQMENNK